MLGDSAEAPSAPAIAEAEVRALLASWLAAQNARDHAAYARLYAARFEGIRRSGSRERRFDRAGWLRDRRGMFSLPLSVQADEVRTATSGRAVTVRFRQRFAAGGFRDEGPKELLVVREGDALRIAREEMLASRVLAASAPPASSGARGDLLMVVTEGDAPRSYVVLDASPDAGWGAGRITLLTRHRPLPQVIVTRRAATGAPAELAGWRGREVQLFDERGQSCTSRLGDLYLLSRVDVHFGTEQRWAGDEDGDGRAELTPATNAQIAADAYGGGMLLVAALGDSGCGGLWARAAGRPAPTVFVGSAAPADLAGRAIAALRALPAWRTLQGEYARDAAATPNGRWDEHDHAHPIATVWAHAASDRRFVSVTASSSTGGCADFSGQLWALFEVRGAELVLRSDGAQPEHYLPVAVVDLDGDGTPEVVTESALMRRTGNAWTTAESIDYAHGDCDC